MELKLLNPLEPCQQLIHKMALSCLQLIILALSYWCIFVLLVGSVHLQGLFKNSD